MKRLLSVILIISAVFTFAAAQAVTAKVESVSGKVEIYKNNSWAPLTAGTILTKGDIISTGFNSEAVISVKGSSVKLAALTRMTVEQLTENDKKEETRLFIDSGKVTANVKHAENKRTDFKVRSPVSTASVRGTNFIILATGKISATEGLISGSESTSQTAQVAESDTPTDFTPAEGESNVFTDTSDVADSKGTPVYAGQETEADTLSGNLISPQISMISTANSVGGFDAEIENSEGGLASLSTLSAGAGSTDKSSATATGVVKIKIHLSEK